jgi:hypothetical protein
MLLPLARTLVANVFGPDAPHASTHALFRDYAAGIVRLAAKVDPDLFTPEELARATAPFPQPHGRAAAATWSTREDLDAAEYRDGNAPLDLDFANYTAGKLVPERQWHDQDHPEYRQVLGQVRWRMHDLGYQFDAFAELDKRGEPIALVPPAFEPEPVVERFGKKYALIAYHELYGFRSDRGLIQEAYPGAGGRPTEVDLDPSFPDRPHSLRVVEPQFLPDASMPLREWVENGPVPDFSPWLIVNELDGEPGPWILLDAVLEHTDRASGHGLLIVVRSALVRRRDAAAFARELVGVAPDHRGLPEPPRDLYTFAGEIPWRATFPSNGPEWISLAHARGGSRRTYEVISPVRINDWERRYGGAARSYTVALPSKQIAEELGLWMRLPRWDLHEPDGRRATISVLYEEAGVRQSMTWIRKDLLERWLHRSVLALVWDVGGERQRSVSSPGLPRDPDDGPHYRAFRTVHKYPRGKSPLARAVEEEGPDDPTPGTRN